MANTDLLDDEEYDEDGNPIDEEYFEALNYYTPELLGNQRILDGVDLPDTVAPIGASSYGLTDVEYSDRFGVTPLYTTYYKNAFPGEYMCDPGTGEPAIMRPDGTVISISEIGRTDMHIERFSDSMSYVGMRTGKIVMFIPDDDSKVLDYKSESSNILDNNIVFETAQPMTKILFSLDLSVLSPVTDVIMLRTVDMDPMVKITYSVGDSSVTRELSYPVSVLRRHVVDFGDNRIVIHSISLPDVDTNQYTCFIHSILMGYIF